MPNQAKAVIHLGVTTISPGCLIWIWRGISTKIPAIKIKNGTTFAKVAAGIINNRIAPTILPTKVSGMSVFNSWPCPRSSRREAGTAPKLVKTKPTVLVTLAVTGGSPSASRTGYETSDANPAAVLTIPATIPTTTKITINSPNVNMYNVPFSLNSPTIATTITIVK